MGQAKQRGTFEQRRAESIQAEAERLERRRIELVERKEAQRLHDIANPKQAAARRSRQRSLNSIIALALGATLSTGFVRPAPKQEGASEP